jgi:hypothetical protein
MENTLTVKFENDQAEWFVANGDQYHGPFKAAEIYQKLVAKEISWIDFCYREKEAQWIRICDHDIFKPLQPTAPTPKPKVAPPSLGAINENFQWFLFQNESQTGPYPTSEMKRLIQAGQILEAAYVWRDGFSNWKLVSELEELKIVKPGAIVPPKPPTPIVPENKKEKRMVPRKPLVAQVYLTDQSQVIHGLCRDVSVGGMQVLTDKVLGDVGSAIRLNVNPPEGSGLNPFVAEGVIVRILEDRRGFALRFTRISDEAKKSIEGYIA